MNILAYLFILTMVSMVMYGLYDSYQVNKHAQEDSLDEFDKWYNGRSCLVRNCYLNVSGLVYDMYHEAEVENEKDNNI